MSNKRSGLLAGDEGVVRSELEQLLAAAGRRGLADDELEAWATERGNGAGELLPTALAKLASSGLAVSWNRRWLAVQNTDWITGRLRAKGRSGALLLSGSGGEAGYFVPERSIRGARDGDLVLAQPQRVRGKGRRRRSSARSLPEARVVRVLDRGRDQIVGFIDPDAPGRLVPFDSRVKLNVPLPAEARQLAGHFVAVPLSGQGKPGSPGSARSGTSRETRPSGPLEDLGVLEESGTDVRVAVKHFEIPDEFDPAVLAAAASRPSEPEPDDRVGRRDLRDLPTITIDGATARDFDDAISLERREDGNFALGVHIADVGHYVQEGGILDLEAYRRGTSVYFPDRAIPMLPEGLSNGLCSLKPGVDRLAMSAFLEFSATGDLIRRDFARSVIRSDRRFTYEEVAHLLEPSGSGTTSSYVGDPRLLRLLQTGRDLMTRLFERRLARGSIDFDLPEGDVILDTEGVTVGVKPGERNVAHRMIEEFMIAANEAVAAELVGAEEPALYRVHTEPDRARFEELRAFLEPLGIPFELGAEEIHPSHLQEILRRVEGHVEEPFVATLILRAMKRAEYDPECKGHYALASRYYTHFTSPIRRYPDLLVHRALARRIAGDELDDDQRAALRARLVAIAEHASDTERRAERAERVLLQWKVVRLLAPREGEVFSGRVTGVQPFGLFVQLEDYYVDGLVPVADLTDDYYTYEAEKHRLVGRRGKVYRLADRLDVRLAKADPVRRFLNLEPVAGL